jgi:protein-L-isoaspartate(D-aspartate) O-methyltransferase
MTGEAARRRMLDAVARALGPVAPRFAAALLAVPRERFVRPEDAWRATEDMPLPLDDSGKATISAPHAYVLSFALADLSPGDVLLELGTGTGYGAALASYVVGPEGRVVTVEIDAALAARARELLAGNDNVLVLHADAIAAALERRGFTKIIATFAVTAIPPAWQDALPEGGILVAPVGAPDEVQRLLKITRTGGALVTTDHGAVRYVANRSPA